MIKKSRVYKYTPFFDKKIKPSIFYFKWHMHSDICPVRTTFYLKKKIKMREIFEDERSLNFYLNIIVNITKLYK